MINGYTTFEKAVPPVNTPIICLFYMDDMGVAPSLSHHANAMSKAIYCADGEIYYHCDTNPGLGRIEGRLIAWKRCWW